jgi:N6-adenosine-specific RNA methylase IME4
MAAPINRDSKGRIIKGTGGRQPGSKNHITKTVKETVLAVFNDLQSDPEASLLAWAKKKPGEFYQIAAKLIPTELKADLPQGTEFTVTLKI